jgi:hypothetical protein
VATRKSKRPSVTDGQILPAPTDFTFVGFANIELEEADFELIHKLLDDGRVSLAEMLAGVCSDFLKFSLVQDFNNQTWKAQLMAFGGPNSGLILTAEGPGLSEAVACLLVKHDKVRGVWPLRTKTQSKGYR